MHVLPEMKANAQLETHCQVLQQLSKKLFGLFIYLFIYFLLLSSSLLLESSKTVLLTIALFVISFPRACRKAGYHWDCSDWANQSQNPLPNITEVPGSEIPDSSSFHSNESNESNGNSNLQHDGALHNGTFSLLEHPTLGDFLSVDGGSSPITFVTKEASAPSLLIFHVYHRIRL